MHGNGGRRLYWVPVIHTQADLGSMSDAVRRQSIRTFARRKWQEHRNTVDQIWQAIREEIEKLKLGSLLDGLPVLAGDRIRATLFGTRSADFTVVSTTPKGPVLSNPTSMLEVGKSQDKENPKTREAARSLSYEDSGERPGDHP